MSGVVATGSKLGDASPSSRSRSRSTSIERDVEPELGDPRQGLALPEHDSNLGVAEAHVERVGAEEDAERHRDGAELGRRNVRDRRLGALGKDDADPVARPDSEAAKSVGETARVVGELPERHACA